MALWEELEALEIRNWDDITNSTQDLFIEIGGGIIAPTRVTTMYITCVLRSSRSENQRSAPFSPDYLTYFILRYS
jgi:hypothetical protein